MNELTLAIKQNPGTIEMNFDALEEQLDKKLDEYRGAVFTEDTKTIAKAEIASLRRLKKDIEDGRKTVKKKWMEPYDAFDKRMKSCEACGISVSAGRNPVTADQCSYWIAGV